MIKKIFVSLLFLVAIIPNVALANETPKYSEKFVIKLVDNPLLGNVVIRKGDLNKNGKIELNDIVEILKKYLGVGGEVTNEEIKIIDMNNNNKVDLMDIIEILKAYLLDELTDIVRNSYFLDYSFQYVQNYDGVIKNKNEILNFIYYTLNSGQKTINGVCDVNYTDCIDDLISILQNGQFVNLNYFLHPYNTVYNKDKSIPINFYGDDTSFSLEIELNNPNYSDEDIILIDELVDETIDELITDEMNDRTKIETIHDFLINNSRYDTLRIDNDPDNDETYRSNTAYGVLFEGEGICSGYADAMAIFLNKLGIPNYQIGNALHVWNLVYVDDTWYHLDVTWDDPITDIGDMLLYDFFLIDYDALASLDVTEHFFDDATFMEAY